jgi:hypothetical protein
MVCPWPQVVDDSPGVWGLLVVVVAVSVVVLEEEEEEELVVVGVAYNEENCSSMTLASLVIAALSTVRTA